MRLKQLWQAWEDFWLMPGSPVPVALFRIIWGALILMFCWWIQPELATYFGQDAIMSPATSALYWGTARLDVLSLLPSDDVWLLRMHVLLTVAAICLAFGFCSRTSAFVVYILLLSLVSRNWCILKLVGDIMLVMTLFLVLSPCGSALSLDRILSLWIKKRPEYGPAKPCNLIGQRLIQIQMAIIYWSAFSSKLHGLAWIDGSAVYYAIHWYPNYSEFPFRPILENVLVCKVFSWLTLVIEFALFTLVWVKELCYPILLVGLIFHIGLSVGVFIPLLQALMVAPYITFVRADDLGRLMEWIRRSIRGLNLSILVVAYDDSLDANCRLAETIRRLDVFRLVDLMPMRSEQVKSGNIGLLNGAALFRPLVARLPLLWLCPLWLLPGVDKLVMRIGREIVRCYDA